MSKRKIAIIGFAVGVLFVVGGKLLLMPGINTDAKIGAKSLPQQRRYTRTLKVDGVDRSYRVYVPQTYQPSRPTPVVLVLHGGWTNGAIMETYTDFDRTADENGFIVMYPNGTGTLGTVLFWNECLQENHEGGKSDDVKFIRLALDDLKNDLNVDPKRIYATGFSDGGIMCYRLAWEMSDCIAAIASVSGPMCGEKTESVRPVSVLHFHGTDDKVLPYNGKGAGSDELLHTVADTVQTWTKLDGCADAIEEQMPNRSDDGTTVKRYTYGSGKDGSEVVLIQIVGGGHTWPDRPLLSGMGEIVGKVTHQISANEMIWKFFEKHPMP